MAGAWYYASGLQIATIYPAHNDPARLTEDGHLGTLYSYEKYIQLLNEGTEPING